IAPALICLCLAVQIAHAQGSGFVQRSGTDLTLNGSAWRFIADNDYQLTSLPGEFTCGRAIDGSTLDAILRNAADSGASVIRTWFFQSYYDLDAQGGETAPSWAAFDRVLSAAASYGLR